jgi:plastocyanin
MKRSTLVTIIIIGLILILGGMLLARRGAGDTTTNPSSTPTPTLKTTISPTASSESSVSPSSPSITILYANTGFSPVTTTVKSGTTVVFKNNSSAVIQVDSNPHPQHTDNTELNIGTINPGDSRSVTLSKTGTWKFHNHLNPANQGTVIVE